MNKKSLIISIIAVLISFAAGFIFANALNRNEISALQADVGRLRKNEQTTSDTTLSAEEIRQKISEADENPDNIEFQKNLAIGLYRYASMKQEANWLPDVARLLNRAAEKNPKDFNILAGLGNVYFDIAQNKKSNEDYEKSREFYQKALNIKPGDVETRTDLGLTFLMTNPPDAEKAAAEFQKALKIEPKNEKTLQNLIQAQIGLKKTKEAEELLNKLKEINPNNEALPELSSQLEQGKANLQK